MKARVGRGGLELLLPLLSVLNVLVAGPVTRCAGFLATGGGDLLLPTIVDVVSCELCEAVNGERRDMSSPWGIVVVLGWPWPLVTGDVPVPLPVACRRGGGGGGGDVPVADPPLLAKFIRPTIDARLPVSFP